MELLVSGKSRDRDTELSDFFKRQARVLRSVLIELQNAFPLGGLPFLGLELVISRFKIGLLHSFVDLSLHLVSLLLGDSAVSDQLVLINFCNRRHLCNLLVHERLSEAGLIEFVVTHLTIAN